MQRYNDTTTATTCISTNAYTFDTTSFDSVLLCLYLCVLLHLLEVGILDVVILLWLLLLSLLLSGIHVGTWLRTCLAVHLGRGCLHDLVEVVDGVVDSCDVAILVSILQGLECTLSNPSIDISKNTLYSQQRLMELCSAFVLLDKDRSDCAEFAKTVFSPTFSNTEISTLEKKIRGRDKMQLLVDSYWEAIIR